VRIFAPVIAIDAGHGPDTPGKRSPDGVLREYAFNRAVADELEKLLAAYKCEFFRTDDPNRDVPLAERCREVNAKKATACISIHANASGSAWSSAGGVETLIKEEVGSERYKASFDLALAVQRRLIAATKLRDRSVKQRKDLYILNVTNCPTILVEAGFMTNRQEYKMLQNPAYRATVARCILDGIVDVYKLNKKVSR
jgi:N-acetylmuramoyl-L-alanine amidase